jgi:uncharacterized membrane protein YccC
MKRINPAVLVYIAKLLLGSILVWWALVALGIASPKWAVISLIVVSEPEAGKAQANFVARSLNTLAGCVIACVALLLFGATLFAMLSAIALSALVANGIERYPSSWRLAPATTVLLIAAAFEHIGMRQELNFVLLRAGEVVAGGATAVTLAFGFDRLSLFLTRRVAVRRTNKG